MQRWEREGGGSVRTVSYAGEHELSVDGVRKKEGHGTERCEDGAGSQRTQGQWRADCLSGLGECQYSNGSVSRGQWALDSASGLEVLQGWGARYRCAGAPTPYECGQFALNEDGCSVLLGGADECLPQAHTDALEAALEAAAQAAAAGERAVRVGSNELPGAEEAAGAAVGAAGTSAGDGAPRESNAARWMRKALLENQQLLVDAFEMHRRADDDAARTAALHSVLDAIAMTSLRDERCMREHSLKGGQQWKGTEAGVGTMAGDEAKLTWLRFATAEKVWLEHFYDIAKYRSKRATGLSKEDWLQGRAANLPAIDVAATLALCQAKKERQMAPRGLNVAKRSSSGAAQASASVGMGAERAPLPPLSSGMINEKLAALQSEMAKLNEAKRKLQTENDREVRAKRTAPVRRAQAGSSRQGR